MSPKITTIIITLILANALKAQDLHYDIVRHDDVVGSLEVKQIQSGNQETYEIHNSVSVKVIFSFNVEYKLTETFENDILISGKGYNTLNGISQKETQIKLKEDGYQLKIDGVLARNDHKQIMQSMSKIHHHEPEDGERLYSQYFGRYLSIEKIGEHKYLLKSPDGENIYKYTNGYCTEVKVVRDFATLYMRMTDESRTFIQSYARKESLADSSATSFRSDTLVTD